MPDKIAGLILAGGRGRRMGGGVPKPLCQLGDRPLIAHVLDRVPKTVRPLLISTNDPAGYEQWGRRVLPDRVAGLPGPLAGIDAGLHAIAENQTGIGSLLVLPGDTPFLPRDLLDQLAAGPLSIASIARHRDRLHPVVALWPIETRAALSQFLAAPQKHSVQRFLEQVGYRAVDIGDAQDAPGGDPFFNINTVEDLGLAAAHLENR